MPIPTFFRFDGFVRTTRGVAVSNAQVFVCQQPVLTTPNPINLIFPNPTPLATIYSDPAGFHQITQPITTDGQGHYFFYIIPGTYTVFVYLNNVLQQTYADQSLGLGLVQGTFSIQVNNAPTASQSILNFTNGSQIVVSDGGGGVLQIVNLNPLPTVFQTSPAWWSSTDGAPMRGPDPTNTPNLTDGTSLHIKFWMVEIPWTISIRSIWTRVRQGTGAGGIGSFAIYDSTGTNKLVAWEGFDCSVNDTNIHITFSPPKILQPGIYIMATSGNNANAFGPTTANGTKGAGSSETSAPYNQALARDGVAGNNMASNGTMPSSLGTLTTSTGVGTFPLFTFEP